MQLFIFSEMQLFIFSEMSQNVKMSKKLQDSVSEVEVGEGFPQEHNLPCILWQEPVPVLGQNVSC